MADFSSFDTRHYPTLPVQQGYSEWAATYEDTVLDLMDIRLLRQLKAVDWAHARHGLDLACGTGRIGSWLKQAGVAALEGIDFTEAMLAKAAARQVYDALHLGDVLQTGLAGSAHDLVTMVLADEHLRDLAPLYREAARLLRPGGQFVIVGYHPYFLMVGIPTHFNRADGQPVAIESHVHLTSDHVRAALAAGLTLREMAEAVVDDEWIARKPKWATYRHRPVSFAMVWQKPA